MTKGILLIGYGTRTGNLCEILERQAARLRARGRENVYVAYYRVSEPSIEEAVDTMVADGVDDILGIPYYIAEGRLTMELIPEKMGIGTATTSKREVGGKTVRLSLSPAFGMTRTLTDIACDRIADAGGSMDSGILVIGHGSRDVSGSNQAIVQINADRLKEMGYNHVAYGFNEFNEPAITDALEDLVSRGVEDVVVVPLFIASGVHLGEEIPDKIGIPHYSSEGIIERSGKSIKIHYTAPAGDDPRLLGIIDSEVAEFLGE